MLTGVGTGVDSAGVLTGMDAGVKSARWVVRWVLWYRLQGWVQGYRLHGWVLWYRLQGHRVQLPVLFENGFTIASKSCQLQQSSQLTCSRGY